MQVNPLVLILMIYSTVNNNYKKLSNDSQFCSNIIKTIGQRFK